MNRCLLLAVLLTGCSSFDEDAFPKITSANLTASAGAPGSLANIDVTIDVVVGSRADHTVGLGTVRLERAADGSLAQTLMLAFSGPQALTMHPHDQTTVSLVNVGTKNADLTGLCGQALDLSVMLDYHDAGMDGQESTGDGVPVTVICQ